MIRNTPHPNPLPQGERGQLARTITFLVCLFLSSCAPYQKANQAVDNTRQEIAVQKHVADAVAPPVVVKSGYYVDTNPVSLQKQPGWLAQTVTLQARGVPLNLLMDRLLRSTNNTVAYDESVQSQKKVNLSYQGTLKGALDASCRKNPLHLCN